MKLKLLALLFFIASAKLAYANVDLPQNFMAQGDFKNLAVGNLSHLLGSSEEVMAITFIVNNPSDSVLGLSNLPQDCFFEQLNAFLLYRPLDTVAEFLLPMAREQVNSGRYGFSDNVFYSVVQDGDTTYCRLDGIAR